MNSVTKFLAITDPENTDTATALKVRAVLRAVKHADMTVEAGARELMGILDEREAQMTDAVKVAVNELQAELLFWKSVKM
jgi:hypothetical protein